MAGETYYRKNRVKSNIAPSDIAKELGLSYRRYNLIEKGIIKMPKDLLREIAERYLDENGVTNDNIREPYIESYISNNSNIDNKLADYKMLYRYNYLTEMMLVYTKAIEDESRTNAIRNANNNKIKLGIIESEVDLYLQEMETTEYVAEMEGQLESI